ncbi:MAG: hypothetical protein WED34_22155 [Planctomycetales bacterium]
MAARKRREKPDTAKSDQAAEWEQVARNIQGLKTFHRMQAELIDDLEKRVELLRSRRPGDR